MREQAPGHDQPAVSGGFIHEFRMWFDRSYRRSFELQQLLQNFAISSPPFTRPLLYSHNLLKTPKTFKFLVSDHGYLIVQTAGVASETKGSWLHLDGGQQVFHFPVETRKVLSCEDEAALPPPPPSPGVCIFLEGSPPRHNITSLFVNLGERMPLKLNWLHTSERSPLSHKISEGTFIGQEADAFKELHMLWLAINNGTPWVHHVDLS